MSSALEHEAPSNCRTPNQETDPRDFPLSGIRVLDLSEVVSGPYATLVLANLGAEVIRIQRPAGVGTERATGAAEKPSATEAFDWGMNRNKLSIGVDLKSRQGPALVRDLAAKVDVVFSNFRPGKMAAIGLGQDELRRAYPGLITCELNGFGSVGPWASMPAYDPIVQALGGTMSFTGSVDPNEMPVRWTVPIGDIFAGLFAAIGVLSAVVERNRTGLGRHVEVAMHDVALAMNVYRVPLALSFGEIPVPSPHEGGQGTVPYGSFQCSDARWLAIGVSDRMWPAACRAIGRADLLQDKQLGTNRHRWERSAEVIEIFRDALRTRTAAEWEADFLAFGIVAGQVNTIADTLRHPQLRARGMIVETEDDLGRPMTVVGDPLGWIEVGDVQAPARLGANTPHVLRDLLGLSTDQIEELRRQKVIFWPEANTSSSRPGPLPPDRDAAPTPPAVERSVRVRIPVIAIG